MSRLLRIARLATLAATLSLAAACHKAEPPVAATPPLAISADAQSAAAAIDEAGLAAHIREFSSDAFGGRGPATTGDRKARAWLVE
ncbi:MAG: hypothetical protein ABI859_17355, partial [Pseudomonadota bacterium]